MSPVNMMNRDEIFVRTSRPHHPPTHALTSPALVAPELAETFWATVKNFLPLHRYCHHRRRLSQYLRKNC